MFLLLFFLLPVSYLFIYFSFFFLFCFLSISICFVIFLCHLCYIIIIIPIEERTCKSGCQFVSRVCVCVWIKRLFTIAENVLKVNNKRINIIYIYYYNNNCFLFVFLLNTCCFAIQLSSR